MKPNWSFSSKLDDIKNIALKDTRLAVIKAAQNIFAKFGYKKTTVDDIARAAHKVKSTIYQYFESKEDIFQTIVEKESQILKEEIKKAIKAQDNPKKKLLTYVITRMRVLKDLSNFYNALRDEYLEHFVFIEKIRKKYLKDEINTIKKILKNGVDQGTFVINDLELTACMIVIALKGLEYPLIEEIEVLSNEQGIDSLLGVLFSGIEKR
jgi:AcrR family transcriptional regulator